MAFHKKLKSLKKKVYEMNKSCVDEFALCGIGKTQKLVATNPMYDNLSRLRPI